MPRVGIGYDVHRLSEGRPLYLGGVRFDYPRGLAGHSDADVLLHALMDAILGAAALGDIGRHFPPTDPQYRGISSLELLRRVSEIVNLAGWRVINLDATVLAEEPRLGPRADEMRQRIGEACQLPADSVSVKATTNEGLGFVGRGEAIAAMAVALLDRAEELPA